MPGFRLAAGGALFVRAGRPTQVGQPGPQQQALLLVRCARLLQQRPQRRRHVCGARDSRSAVWRPQAGSSQRPAVACRGGVGPFRSMRLAGQARSEAVRAALHAHLSRAWAELLLGEQPGGPGMQRGAAGRGPACVGVMLTCGQPEVPQALPPGLLLEPLLHRVDGPPLVRGGMRIQGGLCSVGRQEVRGVGGARGCSARVVPRTPSSPAAHAPSTGGGDRHCVAHPPGTRAPP